MPPLSPQSPTAEPSKSKWDLPHPHSPEEMLSPSQTGHQCSFVFFFTHTKLFGALKDIRASEVSHHCNSVAWNNLYHLQRFCDFDQYKSKKGRAQRSWKHFFAQTNYLTIHFSESKLRFLNFAPINISSNLAFHTDAYWDLSWCQDWFIFWLPFAFELFMVAVWVRSGTKDKLFVIFIRLFHIFFSLFTKHISKHIQI